jgi:hypothetical protein
MIVTRIPAYKLVLLALLFQSCRLSNPDMFPEKYVIPTFEGNSLVRLPGNKMELTFCGDYDFFLANKSGKKMAKQEYKHGQGEKDTLLLWGRTKMPEYYRFYFWESGDSPPALPGRVILYDSFFVGNITVHETITEHDRYDFSAQYTFHSGKSYRLVFTGNYQSSYAGDPEDSLLSNAGKQLRFQTETRFIIKSLKMEIPDWDIDFSEVVTVSDTTINAYVDFGRKINKLEKYYKKELTPTERNMLCQFLATFYTFTGNNQKAIYYDGVANPRAYKQEVEHPVSAADAKSAILQQARVNKVLFFNESHVDVRTRAFLITLLPQLKQLGYNKLALEALFKEPDTAYPNSSTGYYTREPTYGLLLRKALEYGYTLVRYEDTTRVYTSFSQRDRAQARNLLNGINAKSDTGKTIVLAGHGHIYKQTENSKDTTLAQFFIRQSGIVPFCIDAANANKNYFGVISSAVPFVLHRDSQPVIDEPARYDMQVHYPGSYYKPEDFMAQYPFQLQPVNLAGEGLYLPPKQNGVALIYLHEEYQQTKNINELIPVQVAWLQPGAGSTIVYLEKGSYELCVLNEWGKLVQQKNILIK